MISSKVFTIFDPLYTLYKRGNCITHRTLSENSRWVVIHFASLSHSFLFLPYIDIRYSAIWYLLASRSDMTSALFSWFCCDDVSANYPWSIRRDICLLSDCRSLEISPLDDSRPLDCIWDWTYRSDETNLYAPKRCLSRCEASSILYLRACP